MIGDDMSEQMCGGKGAGRRRILLASLDSQRLDARCERRWFHAQQAGRPAYAKDPALGEPQGLRNVLPLLALQIFPGTQPCGREGRG